MEFNNLILEINGSIATLVFNRPKALNALNNALLDELDTALDEIEANEIIRVLILTGSGEKAFIAGADISELAQMNPLQAKQFSFKGQNVLAKLEELPIPVIAAVNGFALEEEPKSPLHVILFMHRKKRCSGSPNQLWALFRVLAERRDLQKS